MDTKKSKFREEQIAELEAKKEFYNSKNKDYNEPDKPKDYHYRARAKVELAELPDFVIENSEKIQLYKYAIEDLDKAIELETDDYHQMWNLHLRARAKVGLKEYESAIEDLNKALELHPDKHGKTWNYHLRARTYHELKHYESALADIEKAEEIDPIEYKNYVIKRMILESLNEENK